METGSKRKMRDVNAGCHALIMWLGADNTEHQRVPHHIW